MGDFPFNLPLPMLSSPTDWPTMVAFARKHKQQPSEIPLSFWRGVDMFLEADPSLGNELVKEEVVKIMSEVLTGGVYNVKVPSSDVSPRWILILDIISSMIFQRLTYILNAVMIRDGKKDSIAYRIFTQIDIHGILSMFNEHPQLFKDEANSVSWGTRNVVISFLHRYAILVMRFGSRQVPEVIECLSKMWHLFIMNDYKLQDSSTLAYAAGSGLAMALMVPLRIKPNVSKPPSTQRYLLQTPMEQFFKSLDRYYAVDASLNPPTGTHSHILTSWVGPANGPSPREYIVRGNYMLNVLNPFFNSSPHPRFEPYVGVLDRRHARTIEFWTRSFNEWLNEDDKMGEGSKLIQNGAVEFLMRFYLVSKEDAMGLKVHIADFVDPVIQVLFKVAKEMDEFSEIFSQEIYDALVVARHQKPPPDLKSLKKIIGLKEALSRECGECEAYSCHRTETLDGKPLRGCAKCENAFYCGAECQKSDWKVHKMVCGLMDKAS